MSEDVLSDAFFDARERDLKKRLKPKRFEHARGVSKTAASLAETYGVDVRKARLAGLLHDWDKEYGDDEIRERARALGVDVDPYVLDTMPRLLHGPTAAAELVRAYPDLSADVVQAIARHTAAAVGMSDLDMIIYIADAIEPSRDFDGLDELRAAIGAVLHDDVQPYPADARGAPATPAPGNRRGVEPLRGPIARREGRERNSVSTTTTEKTSRECALIAACAADEKKATDIMVQEVRDLIGVTDYFVIATASNNRQVEAIIDEIEDAVRTKAQMKPLHREGTQDGTWSLLDYGSFVVHVFQPETREYYRLEALWNDAPVIDLAAEAGLTDIEYSDRIAKMLGKE